MKIKVTVDFNNHLAGHVVATASVVIMKEETISGN